MRMVERARVQAGGHETGKMRHVDHEQRAYRIGNRPEFRKIDLPRIGGTAGDDQLRLVLLRQGLDFGIIDQMIVVIDTILDRVEPFSRLRGFRAVGQMATGIE